MTSTLDHFDTVNDLITQTIKALNDSTVDPPRNLSPVQQMIADRIRRLVSSELHCAQFLLHDYAEAIGLFEDREIMPSSGTGG